MFFQPGIIYDYSSPSRRTWLCLHHLYLWLDKPFPLRLCDTKKVICNDVEEFSPALQPPPWCSMSLQLYLSAVYHLSLTLICPAWIVRRSERAPYFTHNYLISQPLAQDQNRGEAQRVLKAGAPITWWCVYVCVRALCCIEAVGYLSYLVNKCRVALRSWVHPQEFWASRNRHSMPRFSVSAGNSVPFIQRGMWDKVSILRFILV